MTATIYYRYLLRGGTAANLAVVNEVPKDRELIAETDTGKFKLGDGVTAFNDLNYLPSGGSPSESITASEALAAGDIVNIWNDAGTAKARKADATAEGKEAHGYVLAAVVANAMATVYFSGKNTALSGLSPGAALFLSTTPGAVSTTPPSALGNVYQSLGDAYGVTGMHFAKQPPITITA